MTKPRAKPATDKAAPAKSPAPSAPLKPLTVLTTGTGSLGPYGYTAGLLIDDVPPEVARLHASWMDADPAKVKAARADGTPAVLYRG